MGHKTIADIAVEVLLETNNSGVMWGDTGLLDMIAEKCTHTNLMQLHPLDRHKRILDALDKDPRFDKKYVRINEKGDPLWRSFKLKKDR